MRNSVDLGKVVPSIVVQLLAAIVAYKSDKWKRSQDITAKKNPGEQITFR